LNRSVWFASGREPLIAIVRDSHGEALSRAESFDPFMGSTAGLRQLGGRFLFSLFFLDGIVGAVIAYGIFELNRAARLHANAADKVAWLIEGMLPSITHLWFLIWLPAFCATLVLLPLLLFVLIRTHGDPPFRYWLKASAAGIGFGLLSCVATFFFQPICMCLAAMLTEPDQCIKWLGVLLVAPLLFAIAGVRAAMLYFPSFAAVGIGFGLINGAMVRWRLSRTEYARAELSEPSDAADSR
jgi:hypothetical protein